jgi:3'-phosphoadenosine 5'-phosphosulfate sulfotransferase (PAPS reductase)/FAD synthetase
VSAPRWPFQVATRVIVPLSGGKDSQACLKLALREFHPSQILGLFCDTQFEHPLTYAHIEAMRGLYGVKIERICAGSVEEKVLKYGRFPGGGARHCTDELKIAPSRRFYKAFAEKHGHGFQVWYGMRTGESSDRAKRYNEKIDTALYAPHEVMSKWPKYLAKMGIMFRLPVLDLSSEDVFEICDGEESPLYAQGFDRVGCFPCLASGDKWKEKAFAHDTFGAQQRESDGHVWKNRQVSFHQHQRKSAQRNSARRLRVLLILKRTPA